MSVCSENKSTASSLKTLFEDSFCIKTNQNHFEKKKKTCVNLQMSF